MLSTRETDIGRAIEMLKIAAQYIREHCPDEEVTYDGVSCDGFCVAEDCEIAADNFTLRQEASK